MTPAVQTLLEQALKQQETGDVSRAKVLFKKIEKKDPQNAYALYSLGVIAQQSGDYVHAFDYFKRCVTYNAGFAYAWYALGIIFGSRKMYLDAFQAYENAILLSPNYTEALINKGVLHEEVKEHYKALECFEKILSYNPDYAPALCNSGVLFSDFKEFDLAINRFERLVRLEPNYDYALGLLAFAKLHACDWSGYTELRDRIEQGLIEHRPVCKPLAIQAISDSAQASFEVSKVFSAKAFGVSPRIGLIRPFRPRDSNRVRLAYLSPDFREHPVGQVFASVLERHDGSKFTKIGLSLGIDDKSPLRSQIMASFDEFYDLRSLPDDHAVALLKSLNIDVLVDLAGYTADSRTAVIKDHPARVQINYLGYPGSMGIGCMDYIIGDEITIPKADEAFYSEKVLRLEGSYFPPYSDVVKPTYEKTKADFGLDPNAFVYVSFCNNFKMNSEVFFLWMKILYAAPNSILWLAKTNAAAQKNLLAFAQKLGVSSDRIVFAERVPQFIDHLNRYAVCDLFLDTFPYNAHTTTQDALSAGLPVLTKLGNAFHSRVAASILNSIECPEAICESSSEYLEKAVFYYENPQALSDLRRKLSNNRRADGLSNYVRNLESTYINALGSIAQ
jgi:predicted O-linked N-acetylglucosamine transferase (SPINDLY family)